MASTIKVTPQKEKIPENEGSETLPDSPLLDVSDAVVKELIRSAKKRGYVTHDQINALLSLESAVFASQQTSAANFCLRAPYHGSFKKVSKARRACVSASACRKASASRTPQQSCKDRLCFFVDTELTRGNRRPSYSTA
jgi:hypothetical protein